MQDAPSGEKRGAQTDPGMGENSIVRPGDRLRSYALQWVQNVAEGDPDPVVPPTYIVRYPGMNFFVVFFTFSLILGHN